MRLFISTILLLLFAMPVQAATWSTTATWTREPSGAGSKISSVGSQGVAYMDIPDAALIDEESPFITLEGWDSYICVDGDEDLLLEAGPALEVEVYLVVGDKSSRTAVSLLGTTTDVVPCIFDLPPGQIFLILKVAPDQPGVAKIQGRGK